MQKKLGKNLKNQEDDNDEVIIKKKLETFCQKNQIKKIWNQTYYINSLVVTKTIAKEQRTQKQLQNHETLLFFSTINGRHQPDLKHTLEFLPFWHKIRSAKMFIMSLLFLKSPWNLSLKSLFCESYSTWFHWMRFRLFWASFLASDDESFRSWMKGYSSTITTSFGLWLIKTFDYKIIDSCPKHEKLVTWDALQLGSASQPPKFDIF